MNCILAGVGGQGTVLASKLIAQTAINKGLTARTAETIGMAQRGGCVVSHVRIGDVIHSPLIPLYCADIIIGFEPAEAVRSINFLKQSGTVIVSSKAIKPVTDTLSGSQYDGDKMLDFLKSNTNKLIIIDGKAICEKCGSSKVLNIALLGAALQTQQFDFSLADVEQTIKEMLPKKYVAMNLMALHEGANATQMLS